MQNINISFFLFLTILIIRIAAAKVLSCYGTDYSLTNKSGLKPFDCALARQNVEIISDLFPLGK